MRTFFRWLQNFTNNGYNLVRGETIAWELAWGYLDRSYGLICFQGLNFLDIESSEFRTLEIFGIGLISLPVTVRHRLGSLNMNV